MTRGLAVWGLGALTPLDHKQILPIFESVSVDTVVKERDLEALVGTPQGGNQRFEDAVRAAAEGYRAGLVRRISHHDAPGGGGCGRVKSAAVGAGAAQPRRGGGGHHRRGQRTGGRALAVACGCGERARCRRDVGSYFTEKVIISVSSGLPR